MNARRTSVDLELYFAVLTLSNDSENFWLDYNNNINLIGPLFEAQSST